MLEVAGEAGGQNKDNLEGKWKQVRGEAKA